MGIRPLIPAAVIGAVVVAGVGLMQATRVHVSPDETPSGTAKATVRAAVTIDPRRRQVIGVRTVPVVHGALERMVRAGGLVRPAETRLVDINLKADGWLQELAVDQTGQRVRKGQPLLTLYSPELLALQNEYLLALRTRDQILQSAPDAQPRAEELVTTARRRLEQRDVPPEEILRLERAREATGTVRFVVPASGVVVEKQAIKGLHVTAGQTLFRVADLSVVWVEAEVYENELPDLVVGAPATVTIDAYPGQPFSGRVAYIFPYLEEKTRANKIRFELPNPDGRLKPGMYAQVELKAAAGTGFTVPVDAVLDSGIEQVVFVAHGDGMFEPRRITAGRRLGNVVQILRGVKEGERVATGATFFLDSESQLRATFPDAEAPPPSEPSIGAAALDIVFRTSPNPPETGENSFEVTVKDANGMPVDNANVSLELAMPAMPSMNMPSMRSAARPAWIGHGVYRGTSQIMMAGRWNATVVVTKGAHRLGSRELSIMAQ